MTKLFGFNQNIMVTYNENHLKFAFKVKKQITYLFLKNGHTKIICKPTQNSKKAFHFHMTTCTKGIKVAYIDLKRVVTTQVKTKLSITKYKEVTVQYQSKGIDFKRIFGFVVIMIMMAGLIFIMSKRGKSRKNTRLRYKEMSKKNK